MALIQSAKTIRPIYQPLTVSCSVETVNTASPIVQELVDGAYQPDRISTPCVLQPIVNYAASDGSVTDLSTGNGNQRITSVAWLLNGADIATQLTSGTDYVIDTNPGPTCGRLTFYVNVSPGTVWTLQFQATLIDPRNNDPVAILSDQLEMTTLVSVDDRIRVVLDTEQTIAYDPLRDKRLLAEYCAANGFSDGPTAAEVTQAQHNNYDRSVAVRVTQGGATLTPGADYDIKVYAISSSGKQQLVPSSTSTHELTSLVANATAKTVTLGLDLRLVANRGYMVEATRPGSVKPIASRYFCVSRREPAITLRTANGCHLMPGHDNRADQVIAHDRHGNVVRHPELFNAIAFYGDSVDEISDASIASGRSVMLGMGRKAQYTLKKVGIASEAIRTATLHTAIAVEQRFSHAFLADENGNLLTDEAGNKLIFN